MTPRNVCYLLLTLTMLPPRIDADQGFCIFGEEDRCHFPCRCRDFGCDTLTGSCPGGGRCEQRDSVARNYYNPSFWNGPGCQIGNLAYNRPTFMSTQTTEQAKTVHATYGDLDYHFSNLSFGFGGEAFIVILEEISTVQFIDLFLDPTLDISQFKTFFKISLDNETIQPTNNEAICLVSDGSDVPSLGRTLPHGIQRLSYKCNSSNAAKFIKITSLSGLSYPNTFKLSRLVAIGHKFIDVNNNACSQLSGQTEQLQWCIQCIGSYPPECKKVCPRGYFGINCEQSCDVSCIDKMCDPTMGKCKCISGFEGEHCNNHKTPTSALTTILTKNTIKDQSEYTTNSAVTTTKSDHKIGPFDIDTLQSSTASVEINSTYQYFDTETHETSTTSVILVAVISLCACLVLVLLIGGLVALINHLKKSKMGDTHSLISRNSSSISTLGAIRYVPTPAPDNRLMDNPSYGTVIQDDYSEIPADDIYNTIPDTEVKDPATGAHNNNVISIENEYLHPSQVKFDSREKQSF